MSLPRQIIPGATYLLTRRTLRRHLLLRPDPALNQLLLYTLVVSARRYDIQVHALCAMSTHIHLVVTDTHGLLPRFLQYFHRLVSLGTKVLRKWEGPVWDHDATSVVRLLTREAVVEKIAYTLANPVVAGLVWSAHEWPGVTVRVAELGRRVLWARRPSVYLDSNNPQWFEEVVLPLVLPPSIEADDGDRFRQEVAAELDRQENQGRSELRRKGLGCLGPKRAQRLSPYKRATSFERLRERNPTFAVGRNRGDVWRRAASTIRAFRASYRNALTRWCAGARNVLFPGGTWWMQMFHGADVGEVVLTV